MKGKKFSTVTMVFLLYWDSKLPWDFPSIVKGVAKINLFRFLFASYLVKVWSMHSKMDLFNASKILWQNIILSSFKVNQYRWVEWRFPPEPFSCLYKALLLVQKIQVLYKVLRYQGIGYQGIVTLLCCKLTVVIEVGLGECNLDVGFVGIQFWKFHLLGILFI